MNGKELLKKLDSIKYPLLILLVGLMLMLLPAGRNEKTPEPESGSSLEQVLAATRGVGRVQLIVSEKGAVVVCDGAEQPEVRLDILHAIRSYTGFGADSVTVLKMVK